MAEWPCRDKIHKARTFRRVAAKAMTAPATMAAAARPNTPARRCLPVTTSLEWDDDPPPPPPPPLLLLPPPPPPLLLPPPPPLLLPPPLDEPPPPLLLLELLPPLPPPELDDDDDPPSPPPLVLSLEGLCFGGGLLDGTCSSVTRKWIKGEYSKCIQHCQRLHESERTNGSVIDLTFSHNGPRLWWFDRKHVDIISVMVGRHHYRRRNNYW